jgi:sorting nexin-13
LLDPLFLVFYTALELDELHLKNLQNNVDDGKQAERQKKASAQKQALTENMREAAHSIYEEYLSEKANPRLKIDESVVKRLLFKIRTEPPDSEWFDESQVSIYAKLQSDERFLDAFKKSVGYVKLLAELDLLKDLSKEEDEDDDETNSLSGGEELSIYDSRSLDSDLDSDRRSHKSHKRTGSNISSGSGFHRPSPPPVSGGGKQKNHNEITASLNAQVTDVKIIKENVVKPYAMYTIMVKVMNSIGVEEARSILRRYSDFYALQEKISTKYPKLSKLPFPNKKTFGNMDKQVLEKRRLMLDAYLKELLKPATLQDNPELIIYMERFLDHMSSYESERQSGMAVVKAAVSVKNSVKSAAHVVTSVPSGLYHTMESIGDGLSKALHVIINNSCKKMCFYRFPHFQTNQVKGSNLQLAADGKVGAGLETEPSDNIPLRILLLFMDEVFDLQERNQWLRRQIVAVLRQLIKAMFGKFNIFKTFKTLMYIDSMSFFFQVILSIGELLTILPK